MKYARRLLIIFATALAVLMASLAAMFWIGYRSFNELRDLGQHQDTQTSLRAVRSGLSEIESRQRAYLLTGDTKDLDRVKEAIKQLRGPRADLRSRVDKGRLKSTDISKLDALIDQRLGELDAACEARKTSGFDSNLPVFRNALPNGTREQITLLISRLEVTETTIRASELAQFLHDIRLRVGVFWLIVVLNPLLLVFGYWQIRRESLGRQRAAQEVMRAKQEVEAASKAKDQFLANLSHELRTPLTPVLATLTSWEIGTYLPAELREDVELLRRNVELEARLIDDLLDLTRIARGKMSLHRTASDVHALIRAAVHVCTPDVEQKDLELSVALGAIRHYADVDPARLEQVFWNVLKNATKFTPEKGRIQIRTENVDQQLRITISDNGIGMTKETIDRLFLPFVQGDGIIQNFGGLGLGMTISRAIIDEHGGSIAAASDGRQCGSRFTITLPTVNQPAAAANGANPAIGSSGSKRRLRILLVEDHFDTASVLRRLLSAMGHDVLVCQTVADAVARLDESFDVLLSDIGLPDGSGLDLVTQIRKRLNLPAIALTGYGMDEDISRSRAAGFDAHLTKPISLEELSAKIVELTAPPVQTA